MKLIRLSPLVLAALVFSLAVCAPAQTYTDLVNFNDTNWTGSLGPLVQATDGNFYGAAGGGSHGQGNIFRMTPAGKVSIIYSFCSPSNCADGDVADFSPILGSDGDLYGVTGAGGGFYPGEYFYKLTLDGKFTTLYTFCPVAPCSWATAPSNIIQASDGNFYGVTMQGGEFNDGTIFRLTPAGQFKLLHSFCSQADCADGALPEGPPIQGRDGNFYGTAIGGGAGGEGGVVYELTPSGTYTLIHSFCLLPACSDGYGPGSLVQDSKGNFFGTTQNGGSHNYGTVFEITSARQFVILQNFNYVDAYPSGGLTLANDGNLYGTAAGPGSSVSYYATQFEITPQGKYTRLYQFNQCSITGYVPHGLLSQGTNGLLYGTTAYGGSGTDDGCGGNGVIYTLANGLSPLVETVPTMGKAGTRVIILGYGLTGSTSVTFNGAEASFTVESDTYIKAIVPTGATTGTVSVVTPTGTLNSNPQFVITK